jgi:hypothetical protein
MKNKILKYYIATFYLCSTFVMFADPGTETDDGLTLESTDSDALPINDYMWVLALTGLVFVFLKFKDFQEKKADTILLTPVNSKKHP